LEGFKVRLTGL
jgi:predicted RNase H-like nuclease (RuvC/YqgF family)